MNKKEDGEKARCGGRVQEEMQIQRAGRAKSVTECTWRRIRWSKGLKCCLWKIEKGLEYPVNEFRVYSLCFTELLKVFLKKRIICRVN